MSDFKIVKLLDPIVNLKINITPRGAWNSSTAYAVGDLVSYEGLSYIAIQTNANTLPTNTAFWQVVIDISLGSAYWNLDGNADVDPDQFLGTLDAQDLRIKTNNELRAIFDKSGRLALGLDLTQPLNHFHQKSHVGYTGSGLRQETYSLKTSDNIFNTAFAVEIPQNTVIKIVFTAVCRKSDGSGRAAFTREALFYREGSNVQIQRQWQTVFTEKSSPAFDVTYSMGISTLELKVKSDSSVETYWTGYVKIESISNDT